MENRIKGSDKDSQMQECVCQGILDAMYQDASTIMMAREALQKKLKQLGVDLEDEDLRQILFVLDQTAMSLSRNRDNWEEAHRPEEEGLPHGVQPVDLAAQFEETVALCRASLKDPGRKLEFISELVDDQIVLADRWLADKILLNLITNALRAAEKVVVRMSQQQEELLLTVEDNGPGFPQEILEHLFEPDVTRYLTGRKNGGIGEGLCLVKRWCSRLGWEIQVENSGEGARVRVRIPKEFSGFSELHSGMESLGFEEERKWQIEQEIFSILG